MSFQPAPMRASDADRERAADVLREHLMAGRLDSTEFDERCSEVWAARTDQELAVALRELPAPPLPPAPDTSAATTSLILGLVGITLLVFSVGFLSLLTLPISATALVMGRRAHRRRLGPAAKAGMWLGVAGTTLSVLWLSGLAALFYL